MFRGRENLYVNVQLYWNGTGADYKHATEKSPAMTHNEATGVENEGGWIWAGESEVISGLAWNWFTAGVVDGTTGVAATTNSVVSTFLKLTLNDSTRTYGPYVNIRNGADLTSSGSFQLFIQEVTPAQVASAARMQRLKTSFAKMTREMDEVKALLHKEEESKQKNRQTHKHQEAKYTNDVSMIPKILSGEYDGVWTTREVVDEKLVDRGDKKVVDFSEHEKRVETLIINEDTTSETSEVVVPSFSKTEVAQAKVAAQILLGQTPKAGAAQA
jgi:hypothetical protein